MTDSVAVDEEMVVELQTTNMLDGRSNAEIPPERQRRKRPRQRRKRRMGKTCNVGHFLTASVRAQEVRHKMFAHGQPVAPYNTTQFLIADHGDLENIDAQLKNAPGTRHSRTRDSSFSIDSDDEYFYSSPEDEEEFLTKEFSLEYQDLHVERLNSLSKADIIHDYLLLEGKYEKSMGELRKLKVAEPSKDPDSGRETHVSLQIDSNVQEQLRLAHVENRKLKAEVEKLKRENAQLVSRTCQADGHSSTVDSECDSSNSSESSSSSSSSQSPKFATEVPSHPQSLTSVGHSPKPELAEPEVPITIEPVVADQKETATVAKSNDVMCE